jgi:hypothetical protein
VLIRFALRFALNLLLITVACILSAIAVLLAGAGAHP